MYVQNIPKTEDVCMWVTESKCAICVSRKKRDVCTEIKIFELTRVVEWELSDSIESSYVFVYVLFMRVI